MTLGEKFRDLREDMELTQSELGKAVHMSQRKVSYIEQGKCEPGIDDIRALCLFFNISSDYLLNLPDSLPHPQKRF